MYRYFATNFVVIRQFLVITILLVATGCASNLPYRTELKPCNFVKQGDCVVNAIQSHAMNQDEEYTLSFVEFDDQGQLRIRDQLHNQDQMQTVLDNYRKIAANNDILLIIFVHGWHHSAAPGDENVRKFRALLAKVSKTEHSNAKLRGSAPRKVLGVYLGWRGDSISIPYLNAITFWDRKSTAHTVGLQGVTEVLLKLEEIVNVKRALDVQDKLPAASHLVVIGHSFGGAVVYTALQQALADRFIDSRSGKTFSGDAGGYGDLVVLINPAFEATRFATLYDLSQDFCRRYSPTQLPKLVILTSKQDLATKDIFPLGRFFSTLFETDTTLHRHICTSEGQKELLVDEAEAGRNTVGHFGPYLTHELLPAKTHELRAEGFSYQMLLTKWSKQEPGGTLHFEDVDLVHLDKTRPLNPYLNITVDGKLIPNHNDIWGDAVVSFIRDVIVISTTPLEASK